MKNRNQIATLAAVILGLVFLYQPRYILLKGIALLLLTLSAILSATSFSKKRIVEGIAAIGLGAGFIFLYLPVSKDTPILSTLHGSAFHLLFASAIAFGMTTRLKKAAAIAAAIIAIIGLVFLYQPYVFLFTLDMPEEFYSLRQLEDAIRNEGHQLKERLFQFSLLLKDSALHLMLAGMIVVAIVSPRKVLIERMSLGGITLGLVFLCQPFWILLYQTGFQILLGGLTAFIVVAHR